MNRKKKILVLSDHALSTSGVGTQTRHLIEGLLEKGEWSFRQFGAAMKHDNYDTIVVNEDFIIKPIDGFGNRDLIRLTLATEKPDVLFIFTDPRFFIWLFEMEDEIHQVCPIVWWHVWDNEPYPDFNSVLYEATDKINCHSHMTYELIKPHFPKRASFIPHALPNKVFYQLDDETIKNARRDVLGPGTEDNFVLFWINRNAKRKRPSDLLLSWKIFLEKIPASERKNVNLVLHTDPFDPEGPNLVAAAGMLGITDTVHFSTDRIDFEKINVLHNISDVCINMSFAEGFGLSTLEAMQCGKPIIALKTGGQTRQVVDHRDGSENGVALPVEFQTLVGSQSVPYIYEDYVSQETVANAIYKLYSMSPEDRKKLGKKAQDYVASEFSYQATIDLWHNSLNDVLENWKKDYKRWVNEEI